MAHKNKTTYSEQHYLKAITARRDYDGCVEYLVHWEDDSKTWEPRRTLIQEAWTKVSLFEMTLAKEQQMVEFKVKAILDDRPLLGRAAVEAAAAAGGGGGSESKNGGERLYLVEWEDGSRTWEPRTNLETNGVMTAALLDYLGIPLTIANLEQQDDYGMSFPDMFSGIKSPLPIYTVQLVTEEKKTGDEFQVLLNAIPKLRPNIRVLSPRIINNWTGTSNVVAMDLCSDNNNNDDVVMTDVNTKAVAAKKTMKVSDDHKVPHLTIAVIHGDRNRKRGKLSTAQGSLDLTTVMDHMNGSRILVLLQCFAGSDLLEPIRARTRHHKDNGVLLIDPMGQPFVASHVWWQLQHAVDKWVGHEKTWMEALAQLPHSDRIRWWWIENETIYSPHIISPCPICGHKILKDMKPTNTHVRRFCSNCTFRYLSL